MIISCREYGWALLKLQNSFGTPMLNLSPSLSSHSLLLQSEREHTLFGDWLLLYEERSIDWVNKKCMLSIFLQKTYHLHSTHQRRRLKISRSSSLLLSQDLSIHLAIIILIVYISTIAEKKADSADVTSRSGFHQFKRRYRV